MASSFLRLIFGQPLPNSRREHERLNKLKALAVFSSDALSSVAYATEEILLVVILAGSGALSLLMPISIVIVLLLTIVAVSYYQTVHGYPAGGGSYIVSKDNLGVVPGLIAGSALMVDYVLTVAVSVTAGVIAITSAYPATSPFRVEMSLLLICLICLGNLRGLRESGTMFSVPTYAFILTTLWTIGFGAYKYLTGGLGPAPVHPLPHPMPGAAAQIGILLILRAFSSGCSALTGVEAISNGIPAFTKPESDNAGKTLIAMAALLGVMFLGISWLAYVFHMVPYEGESILSQIGRHVLGNGSMYLMLQFSTALILVFAANTAFADFPRLASILARDGFLPRPLANVGDRLVFSNGVVVLAIIASFLVIVFGGRTHALIPLYAVGVFLSFTLSQAGMVVHWRKLKVGNWRLKMLVNGLGAVTTGIVLLVVIESKFAHGAWIVLVIVPLMVFSFYKIHLHFIQMLRQLQARPDEIKRVLSSTKSKSTRVVLPISSFNRASLFALDFACSLSDNVTAVIVDVDHDATERFKKDWEHWNVKVPLAVLESPYRSVIQPLLDYLEELDAKEPERSRAVIVLPEFIAARWWQNLLHNQTALVMKTILTYRWGTNGRDRVIINVPFRLRY